jgi:cytochrome c oxidase subunit 1
MATGLLGMRRRISDYDPALNIDGTQLLVTIAGFLIALSVLVFTVNLIVSLRRGEVATGNVWESRSPEWMVPSPAPVHNYPALVRVVGDPYDYGLPGSRYVDLGSPAPTQQPAPQAGD